MATITKSRRATDHYFQLVQALPLRPIRSAADHDIALRVLRQLQQDNSSDAIDYKTILVSLISNYEHSAGDRIDVSKKSPAQIVRHLLAERKMSVNVLSKKLGIAQSSLSDMLNGKRDWSKSAINLVANYFGLEPGIFLR